MSTSVSLGDAPEFTGAVRVLGVAHAPGYPAYILLARSFTLLEPFGSFAFRVALFSEVCAAVAVGLMVVVCRRLGFGPVASVGVGLIAATGLSWWWDAGFAKPYALTEVLFVGLVLACLVWRDRPGVALPAAAGCLLGLASGANYQPVLLAGPALLLLLFTGRRRPTVREVVLCGVTAAGVTAALLVYELVRASSHPALNWGSATSLGALVRLVRMTDFHFGARTAFSAGRSARHHGSAALRLVIAVPTWPLQVFGEYTIIVLALTLGGIVLWLRGKDWRRLAFLPVLVVVQALGLAAAISLRPNQSMASVAAFGAFWAPATLAALLWTGLALDAIERACRREDSSRYARRRGRPEGVWLGWVTPVVVAAAVGAAVFSHWWVAGHRPSGMADAYGHSVLISLPQHAVLAVYGAEYGAPMRYRQVVSHERPDVDLVYVDLLDRAWYRQDVAHRLHVPNFPTMSGYRFLATVGPQITGRPLYADEGLAEQLGTTTGLEMHGLAWLVKPDVKTQTVDLADTQRLFSSINFPALDTARSREWPNQPIHGEFTYGMFRYGLGLANANRVGDASDALLKALSWDPHNPGIISAIQELRNTTSTPAGRNGQP